MPNLKISEFDALAIPAYNDYLPIVDVSEPLAADRNKRITVLGLLDIYNVQHYGAVGNGIADDTAAIQAALDAAMPLGGIVFFPPGWYKFTSQLVVKGALVAGYTTNNKVVLQGARRNASGLYYNGTDTPAIIGTGAVAHTQAIAIRDLTIRCVHTLAGVDGLSLTAYASTYLELDRVVFMDWRGGTALTLDQIYGITLRDVDFDGCEQNMELGATWINTVVMDNIVVRSITADPCVHINQSLCVHWRAGNMSASGGGILIENSSAFTLEGIYFESNTCDRLIDIHHAQNGRIVNNSFVTSSATQRAIRIRGRGGDPRPTPTISDNDFAGFTAEPVEIGVAGDGPWHIFLLNNDYAGAFNHFAVVECVGSIVEYHNGVWTHYDYLGNAFYKSESNTVSTSRTFTANDATPSVSTAAAWYKTANTNPTTVTMFNDGYNGQTIKIIVNDAVTTIDFTGTNLKGNGGADWSPASGDWLEAVSDGTNWYCSVHDCT